MVSGSVGIHELVVHGVAFVVVESGCINVRTPVLGDVLGVMSRLEVAFGMVCPSMLRVMHGFEGDALMTGGVFGVDYPGVGTLRKVCGDVAGVLVELLVVHASFELVVGRHVSDDRCLAMLDWSMPNWVIVVVEPELGLGRCRRRMCMARSMGVASWDWDSGYGGDGQRAQQAGNEEEE